MDLRNLFQRLLKGLVYEPEFKWWDLKAEALFSFCVEHRSKFRTTFEQIVHIPGWTVNNFEEIIRKTIWKFICEPTVNDDAPPTAYLFRTMYMLLIVSEVLRKFLTQLVAEGEEIEHLMTVAVDLLISRLEEVKLKCKELSVTFYLYKEIIQEVNRSSRKTMERDRLLLTPQVVLDMICAGITVTITATVMTVQFYNAALEMLTLLKKK